MVARFQARIGLGKYSQITLPSVTKEWRPGYSSISIIHDYTRVLNRRQRPAVVMSGVRLSN